MSDLLKSKIAEAQNLLSQASKEEKEREALNREIEQLGQKAAQLNQKSVGLLTSSREKRVIAESQLAAAQTLTGGAPVVDITSAKKAVKAAAAAPAAAAPTKEAKGKAKGKPAKAPEKTAAPAKTVTAPKKTKTAAKAAAKPRVAGDDKKPPLHERLRIVMGADQVTIPQAIERLKARDASWLPESTDLNAYISLALSTHCKETFERVSRGVYKVREGAGPKTVKKAVTARKTNGAQNPSNGSIDELGNNIMENPFSTAAA
jgi:hypothetical protein